MRRLPTLYALAGIALLTFGALPAAQEPAAPPQPPAAEPVCLHGPDESPANRASRERALQGAWVIYDVSSRNSVPRVRVFRGGELSEAVPSVPSDPVPLWWRMGSVFEGQIRFYAGPYAEVMRQIRWGSHEPLPGWQISWGLNETQDRYTFTLTETEDPCHFSYSSEEAIVSRPGLRTPRPGVPPPTLSAAA